MSHSTLNGDCLDRDAKSLELLAEMDQWVCTGEPFCHLRFGDGEFDSLIGIERTNSDGAGTHPETLGAELFRVLGQVAAYWAADQERNVRIGGMWFDRHEPALRWSGLKASTIPWCSANAFYEGLAGLQTKEFILHLKQSSRRKILVANERLAKAAWLIGASQVLVPLSTAWGDRRRIFSECMRAAGDDALFIFCAGMASCVWGWDIWRAFPQSQVVDFGHIFDSCLGFPTRRYMHTKSSDKRLKKIVRIHYWTMFQ